MPHPIDPQSCEDKDVLMHEFVIGLGTCSILLLADLLTCQSCTLRKVRWF